MTSSAPSSLGALQLPVAACGGDDACPDVLGDLDAGAADATASSLDEDVLPRLELAAGHDAVPRGVASDGEGGCLLERHVVGEAVDVDGGDDAVLGVTAVDVGPEAFLVGAVLVDALEAVLACSRT